MKQTRLARAVQELLGSSYAHAKREVEVGHVLVDGQVVSDAGHLVEPGHEVRHNSNLPRRSKAAPAKSIEVLYLDEDIVVVNKPSGLLTHPTFAGEQDTVVSRVAAEIDRRLGRHRRPLIVHRLDQETSGILVLGLNHQAVEHLQHQFRAHTIVRRYQALAVGDLHSEHEVARSIGRPRPGSRLAALGPDQGGRTAFTSFRPLERFGRATLVEAELGTGRTHQVRVHLSYLGHPVLGDHVYGDAKRETVSVPRLALHAAHLAFIHPRNGERLTFHQALPADLSRVVSSLRRHRRLVEPRHAPPEPLRSERQTAEATPPRHPRTRRRPAAAPAPRPRRSAEHLRPTKPRRRP